MSNNCFPKDMLINRRVVFYKIIMSFCLGVCLVFLTIFAWKNILLWQVNKNAKLQNLPHSEFSAGLARNQDSSKFDFLFKEKTLASVVLGSKKSNVSLKAKSPLIKCRDHGDFFKFYTQHASLAKSKKNELVVPNVDPSRELRIASYKKAVDAHLKVCLKISYNKANDSIKGLYRRLFRYLSFYLELNTNGYIKNLILSCPSGIKDLDDFLLEAIRSAEPFPAIPEHLGLKSYVVY